ncbi:MAG: proton-conducting transporter membrane subunit [Polyangiaceae bacterium]
MSRRKLTLFACAVVCALLALGQLFSPSVAFAHWGTEQLKLDGKKRPDKPADGPHGRAQVSIAGGGTLLRLAPSPKGDKLTGAFELKNVGDGPLEVYRVGLDLAASDNARDSSLGIVTDVREGKPLAPGETRTYVVTWSYRETVLDQVHGFFLVETSSAAPGAREYDATPVVAVVGDHRPVAARSFTSILVFLPLAGALLALAALLSTQLGARQLRIAALATFSVELGLSLIPLIGSGAALRREVGNWGQRYVERYGHAGNLEYFVAIDGISAAILPLVPLALLACVAAMPESDPALPRRVGWLSVLATATLLFTVSQNLVVSAIALAVIAVAAPLAIAAVSRPDAATRAAAIKTGTALAIGALAFFLFTNSLASRATSARALSGNLTSLGSLPELQRLAEHSQLLIANPARLMGMPAAGALFTLVLVAAIATLALAPLHTWLPAGFASRAESATGVVGAATTIVGATLLLRYLAPLFAPILRFNSVIVAVVAVATIVVAGARALTATDARQAAGFVAAGSSGALLVAAASLTPQGFAAVVALTVARATALPLAALTGSALVDRLGDTSFSRLRGFAASAPWLAILLAASLATAGLLPIGGGLWGAILCVVGSAGRTPIIAVIATLSLMILGAGAARVARVALGPTPAWWVKSPILEPHGGRVPDLRARELAWALPLLFAIALSLFAPRLWLRHVEPAALDLTEALEPPSALQVY